MFTMELRSGGKLLATKIKKFKNQIKLQKIAVLMCPQSRFAIKNYKCKSYYQLCCTFSLFCLFMYFSLTLFSFSPPFLLVCALSYFHLNIQTSLTLSLSFSLSCTCFTLSFQGLLRKDSCSGNTSVLISLTL